MKNGSFIIRETQGRPQKGLQEGEMIVENWCRGEEGANRSPPLFRARAADGQRPPRQQSGSDRRILETGEWGSSKLLLPEPRTVLQAPNREREAVGPAATELP